MKLAKTTAACSLAIVTILLPRPSAAQTVTDPFTNSANWGTPFTDSGKNLVVANGRMNFTSTTLAGGGAGIARTTPSLTTTQDWSIKIGVHIDAFVITNEAQGISVFLGVGKSTDWLSTHVLLGFERDWWETNTFGVNDDVQVNGVSAPGLFNVNDLPSSDVTLRLDHNATAHTITYYMDSDGSLGGSGWTLLGTVNIASGPYNLQLTSADTLAVVLGGWSELQVVANGQAYLDNLEITVSPGDYAPASITSLAVLGVITNTDAATMYAVATNIYDVTTFSQLGPDANNTYSGNYSYVKTGPNTGTIYTVKTFPPEQAGETGTNHLTFTSPTNGLFVHNWPKSGGGYGTQLGTFQVIAPAPAGSLQVTIAPAEAVSAGAQWQVDGGVWQNHSNVVSGLTVGSHTVSYKTISGWDVPGNQTIAVSAGAISLTNGIYTPQTGSLQVTIAPAAAVTAGAQWQVDGNAWQNSGTVVAGLNLGAHTVAYKAIPGWSAPCSHEVVVAANVTNITNSGYTTVEFSFSTNAGGVIITGYIGSGVVLNIPSQINCHPVRSIAAGAFGVFPPGSPIASVTIPHTVTTIGDQAFQGCNNLTNVMIGSNVTHIGNATFDFCYSLRQVAIPNSVLSIGDYAFFNCSSVTNLTVGSGLISIGVGSFGYTPIGNVSLPNSLKTIGTSAFRDCVNLTNITLGSGVTNLGDFAFADCPALRNIVVPGSISVIGNSAFQGCGALTNVTLTQGLAQIGAQAFQNCISLGSITIPASVASIGDAAFEFCPDLTGIYFRGNAPTLGGSLVFHVADNSIVYLLPGTTGWSAIYGGRPTALWQPRVISSGLSFGVQTNQFGFDITWASGQTVVTEAATNLASPAWQPLKTNTLVTDTIHFNDSQWTNYSRRFYRIRWP